MTKTMSQKDLAGDLKDVLMDSANKFTAPDDFNRHLDFAARHLAKLKPRTLLGQLTLVADQFNYPAPANIIKPKYAIWGVTEKKSRKPWDTNWPGNLPRMSLAENNGTFEIHLAPPPTAAQITDLGATYKYYYFATHTISAAEANTTVRSEQREVLLLCAAAYAMGELARRNVNVSVSLGDSGVGSMPKNGTPAALSKDMFDLVERLAS